MIIQLTELIPVETPIGRGYAFLLEVTAHDYFYTVALSNGAMVTFGQDKLRMQKSYTHGRGLTDEQMKDITNG